LLTRPLNKAIDKSSTEWTTGRVSTRAPDKFLFFSWEMNFNCRFTAIHSLPGAILAFLSAAVAVLAVTFVQIVCHFDFLGLKSATGSCRHP
jgi:hypothetical protein